MSHVDDGTLHAYLDGALDEFPEAEANRVREHLEACATCRDRLEEERGVRDDASAMLGWAAPAVDVPSFEELRRYVRATRPSRATASVRLYRMGWAASVVLALGAGWMLRGGQLPTAAVQDVMAPAEAPRSAPADPSGDFRRAPGVADPNVAAELEALESQVGATDAVIPLEVLAEEELQGLAANLASEPPSASGAQRENDAFADQGIPADRDDAAGGGSPRTLEERLAAPVAEPSTDLVAAAVTDVPTVSNVAQQVADAATGPRRQEVAQARAVAPATDAATVGVARRAAEAVITSGFANDAGGGFGQRFRVAPTDELADGETYLTVVPGLTVVERGWCREGTTRSGWCVVQILESGDTLELIHLPEGADPSAYPRRPGTSELEVPRGAEWLIMRAPVPLATLEELLQRLESQR